MNLVSFLPELDSTYLSDLSSPCSNLFSRSSYARDGALWLVFSIVPTMLHQRQFWRPASLLKIIDPTRSPSVAQTFSPLRTRFLYIVPIQSRLSRESFGSFSAQCWTYLSLLSLFEVMVPPMVSLVSLPLQQPCNAKLGFPMLVR